MGLQGRKNNPGICLEIIFGRMVVCLFCESIRANRPNSRLRISAVPSAIKALQSTSILGQLIVEYSYNCGCPQDELKLQLQHLVESQRILKRRNRLQLRLLIPAILIHHDSYRMGPF